LNRYVDRSHLAETIAGIESPLQIRGRQIRRERRRPFEPHVQMGLKIDRGTRSRACHTEIGRRGSEPGAGRVSATDTHRAAGGSQLIRSSGAAQAGRQSGCLPAKSTQSANSAAQTGIPLPAERAAEIVPEGATTRRAAAERPTAA
jgi:hypothetical protein